MNTRIDSIKSKAKPLLVLGVACALAAPAWADSGRSSKQEAAGVGSGVAIGALAGGPVGAVLGAAFGGWIGNRFHHERALRVAAETDAAQSRGQTAQLQGRLDGRERELENVEAKLAAERQANRDALTQALKVSVYFRTGKSELEDGSVERLARIAKLIEPMQGVVVRLDGFADPRGGEDYNEQLSAARAASVRKAFVDAGFPAARISVTAEGERLAAAAAKDLDAFALERRVEISIDNAPAAGERVAQK